MPFFFHTRLPDESTLFRTNNTALKNSILGTRSNRIEMLRSHSIFLKCCSTHTHTHIHYWPSLAETIWHKWHRSFGIKLKFRIIDSGLLNKEHANRQMQTGIENEEWTLCQRIRESFIRSCVIVFDSVTQSNWEL